MMKLQHKVSALLYSEFQKKENVKPVGEIHAIISEALEGRKTINQGQITHSYRKFIQLEYLGCDVGVEMLSTLCLHMRALWSDCVIDPSALVPH